MKSENNWKNFEEVSNELQETTDIYVVYTKGLKTYLERSEPGSINQAFLYNDLDVLYFHFKEQVERLAYYREIWEENVCGYFDLWDNLSEISMQMEDSNSFCHLSLLGLVEIIDEAENITSEILKQVLTSITLVYEYLIDMPKMVRDYEEACLYFKNFSNPTIH